MIRDWHVYGLGRTSSQRGFDLEHAKKLGGLALGRTFRQTEFMGR